MWTGNSESARYIHMYIYIYITSQLLPVQYEKYYLIKDATGYYMILPFDNHSYITFHGSWYNCGTRTAWKHPTQRKFDETLWGFMPYHSVRLSQVMRLGDLPLRRAFAFSHAGHDDFREKKCLATRSGSVTGCDAKRVCIYSILT